MRREVVGVALAACVAACEAPSVAIAPPDSGVETSAVDAAPDAEPPIDEAFVRAAEVFCGTKAKCTPVELAVDWGGLDECMRRYPRYLAHLTTGWGVAATLEQRRACADAYDTSSCETFVRQWDEGAVPAACRIPGTLPLNAPCGSRFQCESMHCSGVCGTCIAPAPEGAACTNGGSCDFGYFCVDRKCVRPRDRDEACDAATPCHYDLSCQGGVCVRAPLEGEPCLEGADRPCAVARSLRCDAASKRCAPQRIAAIDETCGIIVEGAFVPCARGLTCKLKLPFEPGTCVPVVPDGTACGALYASQGGACAYPSTCIAGRCREVELQDCSLPMGPP